MAYTKFNPKNLGITYSSSTFNVTSANGSALSATNSAWLEIPSKTAGVVKLIQVTADQSFVDDSGSSTIAGNLFGFGSGDTITSNDVPFYIYAVINDTSTAVSFMISRTPGMLTSPNSSNIGKKGSAVADNSFSFFALGNPTVTDYDSNPCVMIGSFRMRLTTSGGDWTVQALGNSDGIGRFQEGTLFTLPFGILGAAANTHFLDNGGTAPVWNSANVGYRYKLSLDGMVYVSFNIDAAPTSNGVGATLAQFIKPFPIETIPASGFISLGFGVFRTGTVFTANYINANTNTACFYAVQSTSSLINNVGIAGTFAGLSCSLYYPAIKS